MELIKISINENNEQIVSGRELHDFLEIGTRYNDWIIRMLEYGFTENIDFVTITQKRVTVRGNETEYTDHLIKLNMAKEISLIQRNEKGKQARIYFLKCEEAWNSEEMILARAYQIQNKKIIDYTKQIMKLEETIEHQQPKVLFAEAVEASNTSILVGELAKLIKQNGIDIGEKRLFQWLREKGYLINRKGNDYNIPTQKSMNLGLFEIKETVINNSSIKIAKTPKITGKGQKYFINKFLKEA